LPLTNVDARINTAILGYLRTFALFGRAASFGGGVPYAWGDVEGDVFETRRAVTRSGLGDVRLRFAVNLLGGPALDRRQFASRPRSTSIGASVTVVAPTGQYDASRLVNVGSNRWAVKPEIGLYQPVGAWSFELAAGAWFFEDNDDFFGGVRREQEPVSSLQGHVGYTFRRNLWIASDVTYYSGGRTTVDGEKLRDRQEATRVGLTMSVPVSEHYSVKLVWADGVTTRIGADFTTYAITLQRLW
jgi:Putative MetA-pathway of phenol degradation